MQMNIKNPDACLMAQEIAAFTGKSITAVVKDALASELERINRTKADDVEHRMQRLAELTEAIRSNMPKPLPTQAELDAWMYDDDGLPK